MKQVFFYALMTMLIISLGSCNKNEDENNPTPIPEAPILVSEITVATDMPNKPAKEVLAFAYDDSYRVKQVKWLNNETLDFKYGKSTIDLKVTYSSTPSDKSDYHFTVENNHVISLEVTYKNVDSKTNYQIEYTPDDYLAQITYMHMDRTIVRKPIWKDSNLIDFEEKGVKYRYYRPSEYLNKSNIDLSVVVSGYISYIDLSYAALIEQLGKPSKNIMENVPNSLHDYQYKYVADDNGYVQSITKKITDKNTDKVYTITYSVKYLNK